jgi:hypothetical protein
MNIKRRNTLRFNLRIPVRLQRLDLLDSMEHTIVSSNISEGGVYFETEVPLKVGTPVRIFLNMPMWVSGRTSARRCYEGIVMHTDRNREPGKVRGIGVAFHFYSVMAVPRFDPIGRHSTRAA